MATTPAPPATAASPTPWPSSGLSIDTDAPKGHIRQANAALILEAAERVFARSGFGGATMAAIAEESGLPKANIHYYFGSKKELYRTVLDRTLRDWLAPTDGITPEADPRTALETYIRDKMRQSFQRPHASRVFANELLHGAHELKDLLHTQLSPLVREKAAVVDGWVAQGRMASVDSIHLFFTIWSATQTYADFDVQVRAVLNQEDSLGTADQERATRHVVSLILRGCGLG
jgi:TetR/AcrR family transcriptional regulator